MTATILTIGIPTLAVLVGILLNRNDANRLDARISNEINSLRNSLRNDITSLDSSLRAEISAFRKQTHDDVMTLVGASNELDKRITRLEAR